MTPHAPATRRHALREAFADRFGRALTHAVRAPGRIDLMGSHTDYNDGHVLCAAIDRDVWIAAAPRADTLARVHSMNLRRSAHFDVRSPPAPPTAAPASPTGPAGRAPATHETRADASAEGWAAYVHGVVHALREAGFACPGFDAVLHGNVPIGSGLSSSAALEVATARLVEALGGHSIDAVRLATLCQQAEHRAVGVPCGVLDPFASLHGRAGEAIVLDCRALDCAPAPIAPELGIVVADTGAPRALAGSAYGARRAACEQGVRLLREHLPGIRALRDVTPAGLAQHANALPDEVARRCRFVIEEEARVHAFAAALARDDRPAIRALLDASYEGARDLYEITVPAMERTRDRLRTAPGCLGVRQAGAGFGGCMVAVIDRTKRSAFFEAIGAGRGAGTEAATGGVFEVSLAPGAGRLELERD